MRPGRFALTMAVMASGACTPRPDARPPGMVERWMTPDPVPLPRSALDSVRRRLERGVEQERFPGGVAVVGNRGLIQLAFAAGRTRWDSAAPPADPNATRYDLASLTKVIATTAAVMALVEDGRMRLDDRVGRWLPEFRTGKKAKVTVRQLLTHSGGVRAGASNIRDLPSDRVRRYLLNEPLALEPGQDVLYSDIGFVALYQAAQAAAGEPLPRYLERRVWGPLGMASTAMGMPVGCGPCAPTLYLDEEDTAYSGGSYDEVGRRLDGLSGNAGAFATGRDVAHFAAMIANEGRLRNTRIYRRSTVRLFTRPQPGTGTRALGWEIYCREGIVPDHTPCRHPYAFGHTGVTGTSLWIDPVSRSWVVLLTNRSYLPRNEFDMQEFRRRVYEAVIGAPGTPRRS
jgi:serine-type D-Ala-D-Ala carboxypeptidase